MVFFNVLKTIQREVQVRFFDPQARDLLKPNKTSIFVETRGAQLSKTSIRSKKYWKLKKFYLREYFFRKIFFEKYFLKNMFWKYFLRWTFSKILQYFFFENSKNEKMKNGKLASNVYISRGIFSGVCRSLVWMLLPHPVSFQKKSGCSVSRNLIL